MTTLMDGALAKVMWHKELAGADIFIYSRLFECTRVFC